MRLLRWTLFAVLVCGIARNARGQDYTVDYSFDTAHAKTLDITFESPGSPGSWHTYDVYAGPFAAKFAGSVPPGFEGAAAGFPVYCVDLDHFDQPQSTVKVLSFTPTVTPSGPQPVQGWTALRKAAWLYDTFAPAVAGNWPAAAALQVAIWDVIQEGKYPLPSTGVTDPHGSFYISQDGYRPDGVHLRTSAADFGTIVSDADKLVADVGTNQGEGSLFQVDRGLRGNGGQDMLGPNCAPEGSSLAMLALGALPLGAALLRARRRTG